MPQPSNESNRLACAEVRCELTAEESSSWPARAPLQAVSAADNRPSWSQLAQVGAERLLEVRRPTAVLLGRGIYSMKSGFSDRYCVSALRRGSGSGQEVVL